MRRMAKSTVKARLVQSHLEAEVTLGIKGCNRSLTVEVLRAAMAESRLDMAAARTPVKRSPFSQTGIAVTIK
jgi:hypothetical protein